MADKILPQRVSAFHSSPQQPPPSVAQPFPPEAELHRQTSFTFCLKSFVRSEVPGTRGRGGAERGKQASKVQGVERQQSADKKAWDKEEERLPSGVREQKVATCPDGHCKATRAKLGVYTVTWFRHQEWGW